MLSAEEIARRLGQAADAVRQAELELEFRAIAFERALDAVGLGPALDGGPAAPQGSATGRGAQLSNANEGPLARISARLGLGLDTIPRIYEDADGDVRLAVRRNMLADGRAAAMRQLALLVVVGRQAAGLDEQTSYERLREECRELRVFDQSNFSTEIGKLGFRTSGSRNSRQARANRHHYDEATDLIRQIAGGGEQ